MAITIEAQDNPVVSLVGTPEAEATIINSGYTDGFVEYEVREISVHVASTSQDTFSVSSGADAVGTNPQVVSVAADKVLVILKNRTKYEVRVRQNGGTWTDWTAFTTRDKTYARPGEISDLTSDVTYTAAGANVVVANNSPAVLTETARGATVVNSNYGYRGTDSVADTASGATVIHNDNIFFNAGPV